MKNDFYALIASSFFALGYPMLRYGLDLYAETGALFFFVLGLYFAFRYLENPSANIFFANLLVITLGFFWKEYSIVNFFIFNILLLAHPGIERRDKIKLIAAFNAVFFAVHFAWQFFMYLKFNYTYLHWYKIGGASGFATQFTAFNLAKSFFALLLAAWPFALLGYLRLQDLSREEKLFLLVAIPLPFMALLWGWVSSRLFYVIAAPQILLAVLGLRSVTENKLVLGGIAAFIVFLNFLWLFLSYTVSF